jgi:two-component sensor histidine kinase
LLNNVSLRVRLALLVAGTALPLIVFAGGLVYLHHVQDRERAFERVLENTRGIRQVLDAELQAITSGLQVLALSQSLEQGDLARFRAEVEAFLSRYPAGGNVSLADAAGNQILNSAQREEGALPPAKRETLPQVFRTAMPVYSNMFLGSVSGDRIIVVDVPVIRNGKVVYALSFNPPLSIFQRMIEEKRFGPEWTVSIFDRTGTNFARVPNPEKTIGQKASPTLLAEMFKHEEAKIQTVSLEGVPLLTAYTRSPVTEWIVAAGISVSLVTAPLWRTLAITALIGAALLLIGLGFAIRMAQEVARGESLQRLMVNELNHRVKNTLATVQSIAGQSFRAAADSEAKEKFESRLVALGRAHNILSDERWQSADLSEIVRAVFDPLGVNESQRAQQTGPSVRVSPRTALIVSMVLHELATNAVKYGALSEPGGRIYLEWSVHGEGKDQRAYLTWRELGGPPVFEPTSKGFGSRLIEQSVVAQLGGRARIDFAPAGVVCMLEFPTV